MTQLGHPPVPTEPAALDGTRLQHSIRLLDHLVDHGSATRSELATATGIGRSAVAGATARLLEAGVLTEGADPSDGRSTALALTAANHVLLTTGFAPDEVVATIASLDGTELARFTEAYGSDARPGHLLDLLAAVLHRAISAAERRGAPIADLTVLVDGAVAGTPAVVVEGARLGDEPIDVLAQLRARVPLFGETEETLRSPAAILPSAVAAASAEANALGVPDLIYLDGDGAVASAIVVGDRPMRGAHGLAAQLAHLPIVANGVRCACGQRGCLTTVADSGHVLERAGLADVDLAAGRIAALAELVRRIDAAEDRARWAWLDAALWIGRALQVVVPTVDPSAIVVGGYWARYLGDIESAFRENRPTIAGGALGAIPSLVAASTGPGAALEGARSLARARLVGDPLHLAG